MWGFFEEKFGGDEWGFLIASMGILTQKILETLYIWAEWSHNGVDEHNFANNKKVAICKIRNCKNGERNSSFTC